MKTLPKLLAASAFLAVMGGCANAPLTANPEPVCAALAGRTILPAAIGLPSGAATIDTAVLVAASEQVVAERGPTPAATITPAMPVHCKVLGRIAPLNGDAPPIHFQVNLPVHWNGRSVQYGGGGFNGVLITGTALVPAARFEQPAPLMRGYVTYGTDSGHQNKPGEPPQAFALHPEALENFAHASYKKVRDVAVAIMQSAYGKRPDKLYFVGSSEGGREGLTMAQRYPRDFDGILSRVPVLNWTGLQHAGLRDGLALVGDGWLRPAQVKFVHDAVLASCDAADGLADGIISDPVRCRNRLNMDSLRCLTSTSPHCLNDAQVKAIRTLHSRLSFDFDLANGVRDYPGRGPSGEGTPAAGPTGGWQAWWTGNAAPAFPPVQANGIAWFYGAGAIQYFYARDPNLDVRKYNPQDHLPRIRQVSALMDATNPDLTEFRQRGGKLIMLENMGDYAQSPYAGIGYFQSVVKRMGESRVEDFFKLYTAPGVDHVGTGAPGNAELFPALVDWVENGRAPGGLAVVEQEAKPPFRVTRARPLCEWPKWPRYRRGDVNAAESFECVD
ncbi:tannase/feruloyl esterase family alpha/beta hydrolase [Caenimonas sedimenti]|nr:tannase/feruloyl esterase family alpha/beta hydrolase [Caenimonas sedimenti]